VPVRQALRQNIHFVAGQAGLVALEASSSQVATVMQTLDHNSNEYFETSDAAGQWIKFEFK
jgi:hypothetical protein